MSLTREWKFQVFKDKEASLAGPLFLVFSLPVEMEGLPGMSTCCGKASLLLPPGYYSVSQWEKAGMESLHLVYCY